MMIKLISFATKDLNRSSKRFELQAEKSGYYDKIKIYSENDLDFKCKSYIDQIIKKTGLKRGYGYWFWKPYIILKELNKISYGDIIHYSDVGCHIVHGKILRFNYYINTLKNKKQDIVAFQYKAINSKKFLNIHFPKRQEYKYTKSDLLKHFYFLKNKNVINAPQYWSGCIFIKKSEFSKLFINEWLNIFKNYANLIDDTPSNKKNHTKFIENRHDQSVYSLLCKKYKLPSFSAYEIDWSIKNNERTWICTNNSPILAKRDLKYNIFKRFFIRQNKNFLRMKKLIIN